MENMHGTTTVVGNTFVGSSHPRDAGRRPPSPGFRMVLEDLTECVISNNTLTDGAFYRNILDRGGHVRTLIEDNQGSLRDREKCAIKMLEE